MNAEDRKVVDDILARVTENVKVTRALSSTLIGRVNGETYDEDGGRMGRIEKEVKSLRNWQNWITTSLIALLLSALGYIVKMYVEHH